jgi:uncharacterized membrane protein YsdA (DUF1294 family)
VALEFDVTTCLLAATGLHVIAWAAFRIDKVRARQARRRIPERTLLVLTMMGGFGALAGMYAHRQRHKTSHPRFVVTATLAALAQLGLLAWLAYRA